VLNSLRKPSETALNDLSKLLALACELKTEVARLSEQTEKPRENINKPHFSSALSMAVEEENKLSDSSSS
jgi:hypothetical protein